MDSARQSGVPGGLLADPAQGRDACGIGLVAHVRGVRRRDIVEDALSVLVALEHRGATGADPDTGDGAGLLVASPDAFLRRVAAREGLALPAAGRYAAGNVFLPRDEGERAACREALRRYAQAQGLELLGWRAVPVDADGARLGVHARETQPVVEQVFVAAGPRMDRDAFERQLYVMRKRAYHDLEGRGLHRGYYVCSLSSRTLVYKGQLRPRQLRPFYPDLGEPDFATHVAMVHARFSTNTFPSWERAQPMRLLCHNGEINTIRGNTNWMRARQGSMASPLFGDDLARLQPVVDEGTSDSGMLDNVLELLVLAGRPLPEALMMMIPEPWNEAPMSPARRAFYEYHSCLMEPWDGPAAVAFTDGRCAGATTDRNGLRPGRWWLLRDQRVVLASETGVLDVPPDKVLAKGRLQPGHLFFVDFERGEVVGDRELKEAVAQRRPYAKWLRRNRVRFQDLPPAPPAPRPPAPDVPALLRAFGYTREHVELLLVPMALAGSEPLGSMGEDAAPACASEQPRPLYDYFKQLFAQVTNPPIDSIREKIVMSRRCYAGPEGNLLGATPAHARRLLLRNPVLTDEQAATLAGIDHHGWKARTLDITFRRGGGREALVEALDRVCAEARDAVARGFSFLVLSDKAVAPDRVPVPALLALGAVHQHLVEQELRTRAGLVVETGDAREVHHFCALVGYGADAVHPWLAFEALRGALEEGREGAPPLDKAITLYLRATGRGMRKVMGKMGISTLQSYKGAQVFEALGLAREVIDRCFRGTASRLGGIGFDVLADEAQRRHDEGFAAPQPGLANPGHYQWRAGGEKHAWGPAAIASLQSAARGGRAEDWDAFVRESDAQTRANGFLRGLLRFKERPPVALEEVEPAAAIVRRFATGAMSFGSISAEAHETLAVAMNRLGGRSNTGEGGEDPSRFVPLANGDSRRSSIKQIASGRFGVSLWYLANADELQIKMAQGAKPGEGGELPGHKVSVDIAATRHSTPGVGLISPPPHHDIYSIEDLAQLVRDLRAANPRARVSVKLVSEVGVGTVAAGVAKAGADVVLVSGHDGGTGAAPLTGIKHAGLPWELGLAEAQQTLVANHLRSRVVLQTDGQLKTGRDVVVAALLGAEEFGLATAPLVALGCVMMRKCHLNTCPVGIATQDPVLRRLFAGRPEHLVRYFLLLAEDVRRHLAALGARSLDEIVGRSDLLEPDLPREGKASRLDLRPLVAAAAPPADRARVRFVGRPPPPPPDGAEARLLRAARGAVERGEPVVLDDTIRNTDRTVGTRLSYEIVSRHGAAGLPAGTVHAKLRGSAGQSFGAWLAPGVTLELEGDANDGLGKGLSGGTIVVYPPREARFAAAENVLVGNVALYGALDGRVFLRGFAAERFCVRNSGATAVVEGTGDHGCEYMTGGRALVLGPVGRNFAAGMSGGLAWVWDPRDELPGRLNAAMVKLEPLQDEDEIAEVRALVEEHRRLTGSEVAWRLLARWEAAVREFRCVVPADYAPLRARARLARQERLAGGAGLAAER